MVSAERQERGSEWHLTPLQPAYKSTFNEASANSACGMLLLPIKSKVKGTAPPAPDEGDDIIDEAINFFRANVLFYEFSAEGGADKVLAYLTLFIQQCLVRLDAKGKNKEAGQKLMFELSREQFPLPGESGWPLGGQFPAPKSRAESDGARNWMKHVREELTLRLLERVYEADGTPNKFWMAFSKKKFMNIPMN